MQQYAFWFILQQSHYMFRVSIAPIIRSTKMSNRSLQWPGREQAGSPDLATLEACHSTSIMTCTGGRGYSF